MYPIEIISAINITVRNYTNVGGPVFNYGSNGKTSQQNRYMLANWAHQSLVNTDNPDKSFPGQIQYFFVHPLNINSELCPHVFAYVLWYEPHPNINKFGKLLQVWHKIYTKEEDHQHLFLSRELLIL